MRVLIIEDEREAAAALEEGLKSLRPKIEIIGVSSDIEGSVNLIESNPEIDIIFADIAIDDGMSFRVFEMVKTDAMVVFTTAYDEFALKAFDYNCADYLLKPINKDDLERALTKCEKHVKTMTLKQIQQMSGAVLRNDLIYRKRLLLEAGNAIVIRNIEELCYVFTEKGFVRAFLSDGFKSMLNTSLTELSESLDPSCFMRINRQVLVNLDYVDRITPGMGREYILSLKAPYSSESFHITVEVKRRLLQSLVR